MRTAVAGLALLLATGLAFAESPAAGRRQYELACARCHGTDGNGGELGPGIAARLFARDDKALAALVHDGLPAAGMPGFPLPNADLRALVAYLRTLRPDRGSLPARVSVQTTDGRALHGLALTPDADDPLGNTRTTPARWWERLLVAPNRVNYHLEHHLLMTVPHYNLPRMHALLRERGVLAHACVEQRGYPAILRAAASR